jgi:hypothetical protein
VLARVKRLCRAPPPLPPADSSLLMSISNPIPGQQQQAHQQQQQSSEAVLQSLPAGQQQQQHVVLQPTESEVRAGIFGPDCIQVMQPFSPEELLHYQQMTAAQFRARWREFLAQASRLLSSVSELMPAPPPAANDGIDGMMQDAGDMAELSRTGEPCR